MKKLIFFILILILTPVKSQTILLSEGFESYQDFTITNIGQWILLDLDQLNTGTLGGDPSPPVNWTANWPNARTKMAFQIFNPSQSNATNDAIGITGDIRNFDPHSGNKYAGSWYGLMQVSYQGNQDWLVSPAVTLGTTGNQLSLWVKSLSTSYGSERYRIGIYLGNGNPSSSTDFIIINTSPYDLAPANWKQIFFNLDAYAGQTIRFGIECITQEASMLMVDDVLITTVSTLYTTDIHNSKNTSIYPNPTTGNFTINPSKKIAKREIFSLDGKKIKEFSENQMDISELPNGNYVLKIQFEDNEMMTQKIKKN